MAAMEEFVFRAKLCEQSNNYDQMMIQMKEVLSDIVHENRQLTEECKDLLAIAFKEAMSSKRSSLRMLQKIITTEQDKKPCVAQVAVELAGLLQQEIQELCEFMHQSIDSLLAASTSVMSKAYYLKLKGDADRYLADTVSGESQQPYIDQSKLYYEKALQLPIKVSDPLLLTICLNYGILHYDVIQDKHYAIELLQDALEKYQTEIYQQSDDMTSTTKEPTIIRLIKANLNNWSYELNKETVIIA